MIHYIKYLLFKSYRNMLRKKREMRPVGYGEINWDFINEDGSHVPRMYSILFYENDLGERKYKVNAPEIEKELYWPRMRGYHACELWKLTGIRPSWYEDIIQKKLMIKN